MVAKRTGDELNGFLDPGCTISGELSFRSSFRVDGTVDGTVTSDAEVLIGEEGVVEGEVKVARCVVGGTIRGTITATESVTLHGSARVWGDVSTPKLVMEDGAFLEGRVTMDSTPGGAD